MEKNKLLFVSLIFFIIPAIAQAADLDSLKADFLQGNYRRVIFEAQPLADRADAGKAEELNYILGLSYLKEGKLEQAHDCFKHILSTSSGKFKAPANLGLADTYLMAGRFQEARDIYDKLIVDDSDSSQKAAVLYRLSQLEFKKGDIQQGNDYLFKLRREFPLSPELRLEKGLSLITPPAPSVKDTGAEYSVQVGFFTNSSNADILKNKLLAGNYPAYLEDSGAGYRVRVGKFKTQQEALELEGKLSKEGFQTKICP
ncbi:MAG: SPOR domain-containing protein [Candidatus Omnitrophica bacterium]|nr:SPOR domain-containing protein [Candidatus Omnitrophota bacterium]